MAVLKDVSLIFLIKRENFFAGTIPSWEILFMFHLIPSAPARASFGSVSFPCLSSSPSPVSFPFSRLPPLTLHHPEPVRRGGEKHSSWLSLGWTFNPGMLPRCQHPAPSVCTRYLIKPGIPRGFEKPAGGEWAPSPHLILTSAVIIPRRWQAKQSRFPSSPISLEQEYSGSSLLHQ